MVSFTGSTWLLTHKTAAASAARERENAWVDRVHVADCGCVVTETRREGGKSPPVFCALWCTQLAVSWRCVTAVGAGDCGQFGLQLPLNPLDYSVLLAASLSKSTLVAFISHSHICKRGWQLSVRRQIPPVPRKVWRSDSEPEEHPT